jgi:hypothetical protein
MTLQVIFDRTNVVVVVTTTWVSLWFYISLFFPFLFWKKIVLQFIHCFLFRQSGKTLSARRWHAAFDGDGRLDIAKVLRRIQRGANFYFLLVYYLSLHCWSICVFLCMFLGLYNYYGNYCSILYEDSFPILCRL